MMSTHSLALRDLAVGLLVSGSLYLKTIYNSRSKPHIKSTKNQNKYSILNQGLNQDTPNRYELME